MKRQKFLTLFSLAVVAATAIGCNDPSPEALQSVDSLNDQQTAEVISVRDGGSSADYPDWSPEQEEALNVLGSAYFSTKQK
ncbi:hypothetical protein IQ273_18875 [Nodosilinea sp. LEGE 07298]|uniref:hypothetical protein n=1 Tax=Nodosilinea sp. LEGE 07298 TaxID=2777970 RepID=UPI001880647C|nr:hypothetical protein [Nodosilinea sp. LEGE 07298]MBE9111471.1 hypothetical protein [Nodosilinea sp. LEGE 07298]